MYLLLLKSSKCLFTYIASVLGFPEFELRWENVYDVRGIGVSPLVADPFDANSSTNTDIHFS